MKSMILAGAVLVAALAACGGGGSGSGTLPTTAPPTQSSVTHSSTTASAPIPGDPLPVENGQNVTFATCVPVFNEISYTNGTPTQTGCAANVTAPQIVAGSVVHYWIINANSGSTLRCFVQYDVNTNDVTGFYCYGNPFA